LGIAAGAPGSVAGWPTNWLPGRGGGETQRPLQPLSAVLLRTCSIGRLNLGGNGLLHLYLSDNCYVLWENLSVFWFCTGNQADSKVVLLPSDLFN